MMKTAAKHAIARGKAAERFVWRCLGTVFFLAFPLIVESSPAAGIPSIAGPFYGYGANTTGGSDGKIVYVDTLSDSGPGSLRNALSQSNRIIKFNIAGDISLKSELYIPSNTTIDGFSSPAPRITIRDHRVTIKDGHNIIVQGMRFRGPADDTLRIWHGANRIVVDHCSFSGSTDGALDITEGSHNITVSWNIFAKTGGAESKTMLVKYGAYHISLFHNIFAENNIRNLEVAGGVAPEFYTAPIDFQAPTADIRNNIIWNWRGIGTRVTSGKHSPEWAASANVINNLYSSQDRPQNAIIVYAKDPKTAPAKAHIAGNISLTDVARAPQYQTGLSLHDINDPSNHAEFPAPAIGPGRLMPALEAAHPTYLHAGVRPLDAFDDAVLNQVRLP